MCYIKNYIALQYAKAAFFFALKNNNIKYWKKMFIFYCNVINNHYIKKFLFFNNHKYISDVLIKLSNNKLNFHFMNMIKIMSANKRLFILDKVLIEFNNLNNIYYNKVNVNLLSNKKLNSNQLLKIKNLINKKLSKKISINYIHNKKLLIGGIIIYIEDQILDNSIRSKIDLMSQILQK
ncbi:ATP synthase F1 subunit delta [Enterobacteriaceae endosymbiont of Plateumaris consimilis]|uniref:ATP synthase F1 subunit delta n=1 Tax=Enterobacteriaceae endosymbiont of Plateumaris consimilis TaxID=2675794 RepID=UPI0014497697|nr:ATP synthase F1 subunit delta [Enterobacteriaceae endosymbiont of Plateumaris consimilis]QJC28796.1 ATP synthase F1 subunit delta [Enterobacteriaceae endosymbiont of Plateumaris consimilis]